DAVPARARYRREARARRQDGHQGPAQEVRDWRHGQGRLPVRGNRRHRRRAARRRALPQARDRDRDGGDALDHRHGALDPRGTPPAREVSSRLSAPLLTTAKAIPFEATSPAQREQAATILVAALAHVPSAWRDMDAARAEVSTFVDDDERLAIAAVEDERVLGWIGGGPHLGT